jgi:hypothetical protein
MQKAAVLLTFLLFSVMAAAQVPQWQWALRAGGVSWDSGLATAVDTQGNIYVGGNFQGTAVYGSTTLTSSGGNDIFVAKLDANGNWLWVRKAGGPSSDVLYGMATDTAGNVYVTGMFAETAAFATTTITSAGLSDIFVAKLDANGFLDWVAQAGGASGDVGRGLALDGSGNIYVCGNYNGSVNFGTNPLAGFGYNDAFIAKLNSDGVWQWTRGAGGSGDDQALGIDTDSSGNAYVTGYYRGTATFTPFTLTSNGDADIFIAKVNASGFLLGVFSWGGAMFDIGSAVALDPADNIYLAGHINGTVAFGPFVLVGEGAEDIFAMKMNSGGIIQWAERAGGEGWDLPTAIAADAAGNLYLTGRFQGSAAFGPVTLTSLGLYDAFFAKLDTNGFLGWVIQAGGTSNEMGNGITCDASGNVYVTGYFVDTAAFGPFVLTSLGDAETFIARIYSGPVSTDDDTIPAALQVSKITRVYPNPQISGQPVTVEVELARDEAGLLSFHNIKGQLISSLNLTSGKHELQFHSNGLPAGIYLYRLQTGTGSAAHKLILMK